MVIDYRCEDGRDPVSASCVEISNPDSLYSNEREFTMLNVLYTSDLSNTSQFSTSLHQSLVQFLSFNLSSKISLFLSLY